MLKSEHISVFRDVRIIIINMFNVYFDASRQNTRFNKNFSKPHTYLNGIKIIQI